MNLIVSFTNLDISEKQKYLKKFEIFSRRADIYYVYDNIHRYMVRDFTECVFAFLKWNDWKYPLFPE